MHTAYRNTHDLCNLCICFMPPMDMIIDCFFPAHPANKHKFGCYPYLFFYCLLIFADLHCYLFVIQQFAVSECNCDCVVRIAVFTPFRAAVNLEVSPPISTVMPCILDAANAPTPFLSIKKGSIPAPKEKHRHYCRCCKISIYAIQLLKTQLF